VFARVVEVLFDTDKIDEAVEAYEKTIIPTARSMEGFLGINLLVDESTGRSLSVSFWDEELAAWDEQGRLFKEKMAELSEFMVSKPRGSSFKVRAFSR
jgi:heme-degrading monooxygenase HmoA